jgi:hypothetical protein
MRIFISYSSPDINIISILARQLRVYGDVYYWDKNNYPGDLGWEQIYTWIDNADIVLTLITDNTVARASSVRREVERAIAQNKFIVPIVSGSASKEDLGFLSGLNYHEINNNNLAPAITRIIELIDKKRKDENCVTGLILVTIAFFLWVLNRK